MSLNNPRGASHRCTLILAGLLSLCLLVTLSACTVLQRVRSRALPTPSMTSTPIPPTATPTRTPTPIPPTPTPTRTPTPTWTPAPVLLPAAATAAPRAASPAPTQAGAQVVPATPADPFAAIPSQPNTPFTLELTEAQISAYLAGKSFEQQGVSVSDIRVVLTASEVIVSARVKSQDLGLSAGVTARGVPVAHNGVLYVKVNAVTLDQSITGFARMVAQAAIDAAIKQYSTPQGIAIPTENITVQEIRLAQGRITLVGRTR